MSKWREVVKRLRLRTNVLLGCAKNLPNNSILLLYSLYYAEAHREFEWPVSALLHSVNTASFDEMSQQ